jgi:hypothetical protein
MKTLFQIITSSDSYVSTTPEAIARHTLSMQDALSDPEYTCEIVSSLNDRTNESPDIALSVETPDALWHAVCDDKCQTWSDAEALAAELGYNLTFDSNKHGSWDYRFELITLATPDFHEVVSSCGNVLRAEFKACRLEMNLEKTWLNIIDSESHCESCVIDADGDVVSESGEIVTNDWTDADWASITNAVKNAPTLTA